MKKEQTTAVLFDLDGLLADSEPLHLESAQLTAEKFGRTLTEEEWKESIGLPTSQTWGATIKKWGLKTSVDELMRERNSIFLNLIREKLQPMQGAQSLLSMLAERNIPCAVVSTSSPKQIDTMLEKMKFSHFFAHCISGKYVDNPKPAPDIYQLAAKTMKARPEECLAFEDTSVGVQAAAAAGVACIAVPNKYTKEQDFSKAIQVIDSLEDVDAAFLEAIK